MDLRSTFEDPTNGRLTNQGYSPLTIRGMILQVRSQLSGSGSGGPAHNKNEAMMIIG